MKDSKTNEKKDIESKNKKVDASHELSSEANALKDALKSSHENGQNNDQIDLKAVNPNVLRELLLASTRNESAKLARDVEKNGYSEKDRDLILECLLGGASGEKSWNSRIQAGESKEFDAKDGFLITEKGSPGIGSGAAADGFLKLDQKDGTAQKDASGSVTRSVDSGDSGPANKTEQPPAELTRNPNTTNPNLINPKLEPPNPVTKDPVIQEKPPVTPKPGGSNNSEQEWRDAELARIKRQQEIDALEKANHSSNPPALAPSGTNGVIRNDITRPSPDKTPFVPNPKPIHINQGNDPAQDPSKEASKPDAPSTPPKPEKPAGGNNSNNSEQEWRDAELARIRRQQEIDAMEKANHSSAPPKPDTNSTIPKEPVIKQEEATGKPKTEQPKPVNPITEPKEPKLTKTDAAPKADAVNKPDTAKSNDGSKPRSDSNSGNIKTETRPLTETPRVENQGTGTGGRKDAPAPVVQDSKKGLDIPKASEVGKNADRAFDTKAQTLARSSVNEGEAIRLQKAQQDAARLKDASEKNATIDSSKLDTGKKSALNMALISSATANLHGRELNARKENFVIPYATLARQSLLDAGKSEALLKGKEGSSKENTISPDQLRGREDGRQAFALPGFKGGLAGAEKASAASVGGKYFDSSSRSTGAGGRFREGVRELDTAKPALPGAKTAGGGIQDGRAITRSQIGQIASPGRVVVSPGSQNIRGDQRAGAAGGGVGANSGDTRGDLSFTSSRSNRTPSNNIPSEHIGGRTTGINGRSIDAIAAARFINMAGRNDLIGPNIVGARTFRVQDGRHMPGVELVMGALLTSAAIAKARRGNYDAELAENSGKDTGRSTSWIESLIAEKINKKYKDKDKQEKDSNQKNDKLKEKDPNQQNKESKEQNKDNGKDSTKNTEVEQENLETEEEEDDLIIALDVFNQQLKEDFEEYKRTGMHRDSERIAVQTKSSNVVREKYTIETGDTLERLAESRYHHKGIAWLIADLNTGKTKESVVDNERVVELYVGQIIELPGAEEAEKFLQEQSKKASRRDTNPIGRLVTIVSSLGADSDIMEDILGKIV